MRLLVDIAYVLAVGLYAPVALYNALVRGKNRGGWKERLGYVAVRDGSKKRIWIHAVSVGEVNATPRLIAMLHERLPDFEIVVSTTTDTGYARAVQLYGHEQVFRFPLDFSLVVSRVLRRVKPSMIVLVELEVWYNLTHAAARNDVPIVVVNGRLTERSARRLTTLGSTSKSMFSRLTWVGAQDETIAKRFVQLGVDRERVDVTSSLKWDSALVGDAVEGADLLAEAVGIDKSRRLWVCGSTGPGEEVIILEAYRELLANANAKDARGDVSQSCGDPAAPRLAIVPRKPERFHEVAALIERCGFTCVRRSDHSDGSKAKCVTDDAVILGDTMGELRKFYSLAHVVFVGRSLVPMGGSDPMEVAALGKAMIVGPHMDNFASPVLCLSEADAIRIVDSSASLAKAVAHLLGDPTMAKRKGKRGREVVLKNQGATARTVDRLVDILLPSAPDQGRMRASVSSSKNPVGPV